MTYAAKSVRDKRIQSRAQYLVKTCKVFGIIEEDARWADMVGEMKPVDSLERVRKSFVDGALRTVFCNKRRQMTHIIIHEHLDLV